ncbi:MAG TPA: Xaa-Pro peptidase family protein [Candidatus Angelobacter sp.]|nr:Xaa-Pro peptidase family protein [Candidatus Angelobacter sp.]
MNRFSRRRFLQTGSIAVAAAVVPSASAADSAENLPPSIASLKSMKAEAVPITLDERKARVERARELMAQNKLQAIAIATGSSLPYYTAVHWWLSERFFAAIIPAKGNAFFVCPAFEEGRAREQISAGPFGSDAEVRVWQENEDPYLLVAAGLKDRGITTGVLGIEEKTPYVFSNGMALHLPAMQTASATPVTAGCRMIKSEAELNLMRLASKVSITAYEAAYKSIHEGMTQNEFSSLVETAHSKLGFHGGADVQVGQYSANPHGSITPQKIVEGEIVLMDGGCSVEGYASDISRTFVIGKPTAKMKTVFDIVYRAQSAALSTARPGLPCEAVDAAARKVIIDAGYGPGFKYFTHRLGHGMGLDGHEWPYLVPGNKTLLQANMMFSDEPGIYIPSEFGVRIEDDMHITAEGAELLTPRSPSLEHPFG